MNQTYPNRLALERRLLAALFCWPSECDLGPDHFVAPAHQALYEAIQSIKRAPVSDDVLAHTFDDSALVDVAYALMAEDADRLFISEGGFWEYAKKISQSYDTREEIPSLISQVRECPRCGR